MSFEFDPNKNFDRFEDGNDPQDIESLGGEGGLFRRVPGGPQVERRMDSWDMISPFVVPDFVDPFAL